MKRIREVNIVFLVTVIVAIVGSVLFSRIIKDAWLSLLVAQLVLVAPSVIYLFLNKMSIKDSIRLKGVSINNVILLIILAFLLMPLMSFINAVSMLFVTNVITDTMGDVTLKLPFVFGLSVIAIIPAIFEETVYRGVFYNQYSKKNTLKGIFLSAFLFGCLHMNFNQMLYAFVLGSVFVLIVEATDSIISSMIIHFIINGSSVSMLYILPKLEEMLSTLYGEVNTEDVMNNQVLEKGDIIPMLAPLFVVAVICSVLAFVVYRAIANNCGRFEHIKSIFKKEQDIQVVEEGRFIDLPLILGIVGCLAISVLVEVL